MKEIIEAEIKKFVSESTDNSIAGGGLLFEEPLVGFAAFDDPIFSEYKKIIGDYHLTPREIFRSAFGDDPEAGTLVSWILPVAGNIRKSNAAADVWPSREWALMREAGEPFNILLRRHIIDFATQQGCRAVASQLAGVWKGVELPTGPSSTWSERHGAYAAGLGTFSLNDALITSKGIAHRIGSILIEASLEPTPRLFPHHRYNCLYFHGGKCGACIRRCPAEALTASGHDKKLCRSYVYELAPAAVGKAYGVTATGCGLCQTRVPCECGIPVGIEPIPA